MLECKIEIVVDNIQSKDACTIIQVLEPDNVKFPKGSSMDIKNINDKLVIIFKSSKGMKNLIGSVDEVLGHIQVALGVMK
ncbi:MAG: KEOPS complex Pcc1-like subunit [Candidatus Nitrosoabyssus spongiisocia]|nr:MAG: KEOPS complex Pcc1-like subunit [Nitrosopumilaceae archaeon AB1(1)]